MATTATSKRNGPWLNILLNGHLHMAVYRPHLLKVHSWANHPPKWKFWGRSRYYVETTQKNGVQDISDYGDRFTWIQILKEFELHCNCEVTTQTQ